MAEHGAYTSGVVGSSPTARINYVWLYIVEMLYDKIAKALDVSVDNLIK